MTDARLKKVARAILNETAMRILEELMEKPMSGSELAEALGIPLTTVTHGLNLLLDAELVRVEHSRYSRKGREMKYYAPVKAALIMMPEKTTGERTLAVLRRLLLPVWVMGLSLAAGLIVRDIAAAPHELSPSSIAYYSFMAGAVFALIIYLLSEEIGTKLRKRRTNPRGNQAPDATE